MDKKAMKAIPVVTNIFRCPNCKEPIYLPSPNFNPNYDVKKEMPFCKKCRCELDWN